MASLVDWTMGVATQLDRALGYEANANGTNFLTDPPLKIRDFAFTSLSDAV